MKPCAKKPNQTNVEEPTKPSEYNQYLGVELMAIVGVAIVMLLLNTPNRAEFNDAWAKPTPNQIETQPMGSSK